MKLLCNAKSESEKSHLPFPTILQNFILNADLSCAIVSFIKWRVELKVTFFFHTI